MFCLELWSFFYAWMEPTYSKWAGGGSGISGAPLKKVAASQHSFNTELLAAYPH